MGPLARPCKVSRDGRVERRGLGPVHDSDVRFVPDHLPPYSIPPPYPVPVRGAVTSRLGPCVA